MIERTSHDDLSDCMPDVDTIMHEARHGRGEQKMREALSRDTPAPPLTHDPFEEDGAPHDTWGSKPALTREASRRDAPDDARSAKLAPREPQTLQKKLARMPFWMQVMLGAGAVAAPCLLMFVLLVWRRDEGVPKGAAARAPDTTPSAAASIVGSPKASTTATVVATASTVPPAPAPSSAASTPNVEPTARSKLKPPMRMRDDPYRDAEAPPPAKTKELEAPPPTTTIEPQAPPSAPPAASSPKANPIF